MRGCITTHPWDEAIRGRFIDGFNEYGAIPSLGETLELTDEDGEFGTKRIAFPPSGCFETEQPCGEPSFCFAGTKYLVLGWIESNCQNHWQEGSVIRIFPLAGK